MSDQDFPQDPSQNTQQPEYENLVPRDGIPTSQDRLSVNWIAVLRSISKLINDIRANATADMLLEDILQISRDLGI